MRYTALCVPVWTVLFIVVSANAGQGTIPNYATARGSYFWSQVYAFGGVTIYCDHIFPDNDVYEAVGGNRVSVAMGG